jgi:tetratricopeptide (TPR) repeat protein
MADPGSGEGTVKGNAAYAEGKYEDAVSHWKQSYKSIAYVRGKNVYEKESDGMAELNKMELRLALNLAQGYLKLRKWADAEEFARAALAHDPDNEKAKFRLASALTELGQVAEATTLLRAVDNAAAKKLLAQVVRDEEIARRKAKRHARSMFASTPRPWWARLWTRVQENAKWLVHEVLCPRRPSPEEAYQSALDELLKKEGVMQVKGGKSD